MIHHIDNNKKDLHMTSIKSLEGEQMEEKLNCMASNSKEDLISELPETVLLHILSFLPTKESIHTSVVAKRWKNLWKSVPSLKFEICLSKGKLYKQNSEKFMDFVDKVFILRGDSSALSEFHLSYCDNGKGDTSFPYRLNLWIEYVARLKPRLLDLKLFSPLLSSIQLPTMKTLETLNMRGYSPIGTVHLQSPSGFHRLKILKLRNVDFCLGEFGGFPILKELQLRDCRFVGDSMLNISLPSLRILIMRNYSAVNHEIKVSTPCLESFVLDGRNIFVFDRLYSLSELVIGGSTSDPICIDKLCKIVTGSRVRVFFWRHSYFMWNRLLEGLRACDAAPLANLKRLCLWLFRCNCHDYVASVIYLLENSPNLEKLVIPGFMENAHHGEHNKENCQPAKVLPNFTHRSLKKIEVAYNRKDYLQREWVKLLNSGSPRLKLKRFPVNSYYQLQYYHFRLPTF